VRIISMLGFPVVVLFCFLPASARFLIAQCRFSDAVLAVQLIARVNGTSIPEHFTVENLQQAGPSTLFEKVPKESFVQILRSNQGFTLGVLLLVWFMNSFTLSVLSFIPMEFEKRFPAVEGSAYKASVALALGGFLGSFIVTFLSSRLNRIFELRVGLAILTVFICTISLQFSPVSTLLGGLMLVHVGMSITFHSQYTFTPESFSTGVRVTAFASCNFINRAGSMIGSFAFASLMDSWSFQVAIRAFSTLWILAAAATLPLTRETKDMPFVEELCYEKQRKLVRTYHTVVKG